MVMFSKKTYKIINKNNIIIIPEYIEIDKQKYKLTTDIYSENGFPSGAFGTVIFYKYNRNKKIAVKIINLSEMQRKENGSKKVLKSKKEADIMKLFQKKFSSNCKGSVILIVDNIIKTINKEKFQYIIMEKMDTDLKGFIKKEINKSRKKSKYSKSKKSNKNKKSGLQINYDLKLVKNIIRQILQSLKCMHQKGIVYNDLKLSNILWNYKDKKIKVTDFNCVLSKDEPDMTGCSTLTYRSPEQITHNSSKNNYKTDIWSLGVIMLSLLMKNNKLYFNVGDKNKIKNAITKFSIEEIHSIIKINMKKFQKKSKKEYFNIIDFLKKVLEKDYNKRLTAAQCLTHPFLKK